ncbi:disulfide bond formation protein B [Scleromatobacter humisilvae]|uniref:Disulfide bond formation protein B n=1 Tax=Scleromatobacter humisilvae TaxID=2897159 RepID=A0A9X1YIC3_9BURK|nr:disulfide bond formation protein B [Scleromatobacter humisilvae]MCK9686693.1 disulfide bond formation protein B [Scleromatobacter humisilvae]
MRIRIRIPQVLTIIGLVALGAVGLAAIAQYRFDMQPCPWCVLQRLIYIVVGVLALLGAVLSNTPRRLAVGLAFLGALWGIGTALYQQLHAVNEASCDLSMAERFIAWLKLDQLLPQLFVAYASCADAAVSVLHIPFAVWSCILFAILALLLAWTLRASMRTR